MISFRTETGGSNGGGGKGPAKDLYGGQAQNENELFAQDQVKWIDFQPKRSSVCILLARSVHCTKLMEILKSLPCLCLT